MGPNRSPLHRMYTPLSFALSRAGGLFLCATSFCLASGSPWLERLEFDPVWLFSSGLDSDTFPVPTTSISVRSSSDVAIRSPLRQFWTTSEIDQTNAFRIGTDQMWGSGWLQGSVEDQKRNTYSRRLTIESPSWTSGVRAGAFVQLGFLGLRTETAQMEGIESYSGAIRIAPSFGSLEGGLSQGERRSQMRIVVTEGVLNLDWNDISDSIGTKIVIPLGPTKWMAQAWLREEASPERVGLTDSGSAYGWKMGTSIETPWGEWALQYGIDRSSLRTMGFKDDRLFHEQNWSTVRATGDAQWKGGAWQAVASTRQIRIEIPTHDLNHPFVNWNMLSDDNLVRIASFLQNKKDYFDGSIRIERWSGQLKRTWNLQPISILAGIGGSWTGYSAKIDRTDREVTPPLFFLTSTTHDNVCDGSGWIAMAEASVSIDRRIGNNGLLTAGGTWRQPFTGRGRDANESVQQPTSKPAAKTNAVDPLGFYEWNLTGLLAF